MGHRSKWLRWIVVVLVACWFAGAWGNAVSTAMAQDEPDSSVASGGPLSSASGEVLIQPVLQGIGGRVRPGEITPFLFTVTDRGTTIRNVMIRLGTIDIDGDTTQWSRPVTTTPGKPVSIWMYARVPFESDTFNVTAHEAIERAGTTDESGQATYEAGRRLGSTTFRLSNAVNPSAGMMVIIGTNRCGLDAYAIRQQGMPGTPMGHEYSEIIPSTRPVEIPDRGMGLRGYDAIIWTGSSSEEQPAKLTVPQADAMREWIASGGHLIVLVPSVGQTWIDSAANPLADIMPNVDAKRRDNVDLTTYRALLTRRDKKEETDRNRPIQFPSSTIVHAFEARADAGPYDAMPILASPKDPQGKQDVVVVRRLFGAGAVTLVGLDLTHAALTGDALRADFFWHRVLGRRGDLSSLNELRDRSNAGTLNLPITRDPDVAVDAVIQYNTEREGRSAGGLLLALIVFGAFWLAAGPFSFFILKKRRLAHHSWLAFAACIVVFTAISWTGASLLRQRTPDAKFVALIDHVYGQPTQRARVWANLFLPNYGSQRVSVAESVPKESKWRPVLAPWEPATKGAASSPFPDVRGYDVSSRAPESILFPSRSTEKRIQVDWIGPPKWDMPLPIAPESSDAASPVFGNEIKVVPADVAAGRLRESLSGTLKHSLPGTLEDVQIIIVRGQSELSPRDPNGLLPANVTTVKWPTPWQPGEELTLDSLFKPGQERLADGITFLRDLLPTGSGGIGDPTRALQTEPRDNIVKYLERMSLFGMIPAPEVSSTNGRAALIHRENTHGCDLSRWFTQPCLIVIGHLKRGPSPVPIHVDGEEIDSEGHTVVRWVYPLPGKPPQFQTGTTDSDKETPSSDGG